jgi:hypothetical protein
MDSVKLPYGENEVDCCNLGISVKRKEVPEMYLFGSGIYSVWEGTPPAAGGPQRLRGQASAAVHQPHPLLLSQSLLKASSSGAWLRSATELCMSEPCLGYFVSPSLSKCFPPSIALVVLMLVPQEQFPSCHGRFRRDLTADGELP